MRLVRIGDVVVNLDLISGVETNPDGTGAVVLPTARKISLSPQQASKLWRYLAASTVNIDDLPGPDLPPPSEN